GNVRSLTAHLMLAIVPHDLLNREATKCAAMRWRRRRRSAVSQIKKRPISTLLEIEFDDLVTPVTCLAQRERRGLRRGVAELRRPSQFPLRDAVGVLRRRAEEREIAQRAPALHLVRR